jgi:hypothetical protein
LGGAAEQRRQILILEQRRARLQELPPGGTRDAILKALDEKIIALKEAAATQPSEFRQLS